MKYLRSFFLLLLVLSVLVSVCPLPAVQASNGDATDLRGNTTIFGVGYDSFSFLLDNNLTSYKKSSGNTTINLENVNGIGSLYLLLHKQYGSYTITDNATGNTITAGENGFLHEFVDLVQAYGYAPTSVTIAFQNGAVQLSEIYVFSEGTPPQYVQRWEMPLEGSTDLLLLATHGDDDQLFFAGLLPLYAGELDLRVQVVYLTDHRSGYVDNARMHEMLNGLWAVGVEAYPVFGSFADFRIDSLKDTYTAYKNSYNTTKEQLLSFVVEQIRRFRPQVIVGHDINGEYGHGMHMVYTDLLIQALDITADSTVFPDSVETYGTWEVPKTYLHLYDENQIVLDYDQPLSAFAGLTAFQATQKLGYPCHKSPQYTWFTQWINGNNGQITKATEIATYNPCYFGLYRSTVGADVQKNDFMENIVPYQQQWLDQQAADAVSALLAQLGPITLDSADSILTARNAFDALTQRQQSLVTNPELLTKAEALYAQLLEEKARQDAADQAAAEAVIALIDAIPEDFQDNTEIRPAREAYDRLTDAQKALVTNLDKLLKAETDYETYLQLVQQLLEEERIRLEQEQLDRQIKDLQHLCIILVVLTLLFLVSLLALRHKRKCQKKS